MGLLHFINDIFSADTEEDQLKRIARGGQRYYSEDETARGNNAPASNPLTQARNLAVGAVRGLARVPETAARSGAEYLSGGVGTGMRKKLQLQLDALPEEAKKDPRYQQMVAETDKIGNFDSGEITDPIRRTLYGKEAVQTYQTRRKGYEKTLGESRFRGGAAALSFLGMGLTVGLDAPLGAGNIAKGLGKGAIKSIAKETSETGVIKTLSKAGISDDVAKKLAPQLAKETNEATIKKMVSKTALKKLGKETATTPQVSKTNPFKIQDTNQEVVIHGKWDNGGGVYRERLENSGDIFRELSGNGDPSYISEKTFKLRRYLSELQSGKVHPDDMPDGTLKTKQALQLKEQWLAQPVNTKSQQLAKDLNLAMLDGDYIKAKSLLNDIDNLPRANNGWIDDAPNNPANKLKQSAPQVSKTADMGGTLRPNKTPQPYKNNVYEAQMTPEREAAVAKKVQDMKEWMKSDKSKYDLAPTPKRPKAPVKMSREDFNNKAMVMSDNLKPGEKGYITDGGKTYEISSDSKKAKLVSTPVAQVSKTVDATGGIVETGKRTQLRFLDTQAHNEALPIEARIAASEIDPQKAATMDMKATFAKAETEVATNYDRVLTDVSDQLDAGTIIGGDTSARVQALMDKAWSEGRAEDFIALGEKAAPLFRQQGQGNVMLRMVQKSVAKTPKDMVEYAQKIVDDANKNMRWFTKTVRNARGKGMYTLDDVTKTQIYDDMTKVLGLPAGPEKDAVLDGIMKTIADQVPIGASEFFDAYRYTNLLSSPRTQARNTISNLFNTMVTRPATLAVRAQNDWVASFLHGAERQHYFKEVPAYYKGMLNAWYEANEAVKGVWTGATEIAQPDLSMIKGLRDSNMPKVLTAVPRFMEAQDKWFSTMIASGEKAALMASGVGEEAAEKAAQKVAQYSLFRAALDPKNLTGQGKLLSAIDKVSASVTKLGQQHPTFRWFVPFIRTPMNISKQFIEFSPAGLATLPGAAQKSEQLAKVMLGTTVMGMGASLALQGKTTWGVPKDPEQRALFYAAGKKPYSIQIGDTWVPMIMFGPFAYTLGLGASMKDVVDTSKADAGFMDKATKILQNQVGFFSQQTYVQGMANFIDVVSGDGDASLMGSLGFTASQALPFSALQRYISSIQDPIFRKKTGFVESLKENIPLAGGWLSQTNEPYEDALTGEPARRNITDYLSPYTLGTFKGTDEQQRAILQGEDFYKALRKVSPLRNKYDEKINAAILANDVAGARQLAESFNDKLRTSFKPWINKYGSDNHPEKLISLYNQTLIKLTRNSIAQRKLRQLKAKQGGIIPR